MRTIYQSGFQLLKMRFVQVITIVTGVFAAFAGAMILSPPANASTDPSQDLPSAWLWGGGFVVFGFVVAAAIWYYSQVYISRVEVDDDERRLRLTFPGFIFPHRLELGFDDVVSATFHEGYSRTGGVTVNAPWETVRIRGSRRSFVLDLHGDYLDEGAVEEHLLRYRERYPHWRPPVKKPSPSPLIEAAKQRKRKRRR